jgi:hypothetical protein
MTDDDASLSTLGDDPGLVVEVAVGHEGWRHGEITLVVDGGDVVSVRQRRSGRKREWQGRLDSEQLHALGDRLAELGREPVAPRAEAIDPDDDPIRLIVAVAARPSARSSFAIRSGSAIRHWTACSERGSRRSCT